MLGSSRRLNSPTRLPGLATVTLVMTLSGFRWSGASRVSDLPSPQTPRYASPAGMVWEPWNMKVTLCCTLVRLGFEFPRNKASCVAQERTPTLPGSVLGGPFPFRRLYVSAAVG